MQRSVKIIRAQSSGQQTFGQSPRNDRGSFTGRQRSGLANLAGFDAVDIGPSSALRALNSKHVVTFFITQFFCVRTRFCLTNALT